MQELSICDTCGGIGQTLWKGSTFVLCVKCHGKGKLYAIKAQGIEVFHENLASVRHTRDNTHYHGYKGTKRGKPLYGFKTEVEGKKDAVVDPIESESVEQ